MNDRYHISSESHHVKFGDVFGSKLRTAEMPPKRLHYFFENRCDADPKSVALVCGAEHLTYAELDVQANQLANYFVHKGITLGKRVGILLQRSIHTYVTLLAVLKCGAAFVPLDPSFPQDRITFIAEDASLDLLVTTTDFMEAIIDIGCEVLALDLVTVAIAKRCGVRPWRLPLGEAPIAQQPKTRPAIPDTQDELCYIIYTSGSTGRPKGVAVNHSSICNFLTVCTPIYGVTPWDRVYQGMTIAFDFSIEEIWPTFIVGATLIAGPTDYRRLGSGLADFLIEEKVTVLYCVPTLLATVDRDVPSVRTLIVGGEACPQDLVKRWSRVGRRILNTYGPTETTVTALWTELFPDEPVTIGRPLPTYSVYILDEELRPVPQGEVGEICISGIGVARGYINRPEFTASKFVLNPFEQSSTEARLYRTGDLGRVTTNGDIEYLGRIDSQVKIRGYRIELTEIEAILLENPEIENAIVSVVSNNSGIQELVAYITLLFAVEAPEDLKTSLHSTLRSRLPSYMIPAYIEILDTIPTLPNGKADRSKLPMPNMVKLSDRSDNHVPPATPLEQELVKAWNCVFGRDKISVEEDFFKDLGGHSLFAAQVISNLRQNRKLNHLSIGDLYLHSTIRDLATHIEGSQLSSKSIISQTLTEEDDDLRDTGLKPERIRRRHSNLRVWVCGCLQMLCLYVLFVVLGTPSILLISQSGIRSSLTLEISSTILILFIWILTILVLPIAAKWLLIGRFRPGRYPLWGWYYCRWWLVGKIMTLAPLDYLAGSPLMPIYLRLLGGRIGKGCYIGTGRLHMPDLIEIGDEASIGYSVEIQPFAIEDGWLYQAPIRIGANAFVGTNSVLMLGGNIGQWARLAEQSLVARDQMIPTGQTWSGSPSKRITNTDPILDNIADRKPSNLKYSPILWVGFFIGFVFIEILPFLIFIPGLIFQYAAAGDNLFKQLIATPIAGLIFVVTTCTLVAVGKRLLMPTVQPGIFQIQSGFGFRKWLTDKLMLTSLAVTNTLYATLYTLPWLRLLGAKIGTRSEVSTVAHIDPDLLTLGSESFVADFAAIGPAKHYNGFMALGATELGNRCFIGNAALVPANTRLGDDCLIGVHSLPPTKPVESGTSWLGSPAIFLPHRQKSQVFDETVTFRPPVKLVAYRLGMEFLRIVLPLTLTYVLAIENIIEIVWVTPLLSVSIRIAVMPFLYIGSAFLVTGLVAALKWLIIGRYRPRVEPLWSNFVWRTELITGLYETVAVPFLIRWLTGTPLLAPSLRLFGAKIGRRVYMDTTFLTEFDLVRVGDDAAIGSLTSLQTHLFEDRVMKMSAVRIGQGCTVGPRSVVLYDSVMETGSKLDGLSLVMKSEVLPSQTQWQGIPAGYSNA
ncbi:amino acid adenylation domain-containing protein [Aetokthonos hydrillicola Thurmond2011]|uniref:Amino acid adenylation domain-containing protein n=2 Tax=Aetokthonos TaxID=1550243 RepID=A0AAP5IB54_9CYAN|nr:Pls/PosA family non-ribosomal peptide synthetase [Aetokthonos hydrillicola]MBW4590337.1 amino acid adenylation domain-containing protein [Aetokthonos hydrillicola CCALA 1050]MDR9896877.1 amino acid adenylation domain-containing protein [Aetokthonos hydrillicola Thurmond2011]